MILTLFRDINIDCASDRAHIKKSNTEIYSQILEVRCQSLSVCQLFYQTVASELSDLLFCLLGPGILDKMEPFDRAQNLASSVD